ncbi:hypothetical protein HBH43_142750 [Parastagonospora nodorum]|nr:hypothetical protein HBH43_142750 [Parastagonospora nodorum]KAH4440419.1 hypothetical protein HBH93_086880 [Parastagonospora nodorum]KAH4710424.1 hypothetical protein HBH67_043290 [Parastagonospora nodorum]
MASAAFSHILKVFPYNTMKALHMPKMSDSTMQGLDLIKTHTPWILMLLAVSWCIFKPFQAWYFKPGSRQPTSSPKKQQTQDNEEAYHTIHPLPHFHLEAEQPLKLRPFKPIYHMTMALESTTFSDLIAMDNTFSSRCSIRKGLIQSNRHDVLACTPRGAPAVLELYHWLTSTYLPRRFPSLYTQQKNGLHNTITGETMPFHLPSTDAESALQYLGENIDTDFFLLLPSLNAHDEGKYRLEAFINTFPSGFNTRSKLGRLLADIHAPVPHYAAKLEKSMDRFFASLPVGKMLKRANWSISTNGELRALVFAFKTYQYPIQEVKDEGSGEILAQAIDGLARGSVPDIRIYKRQVVWGEKVKAFLRGEINA